VCCGAQAVLVTGWDVDDVNLDACQWHGRANVGRSVGELVSGLVGQLGMDVTAPASIDVDDHAGQALTLSPADVDSTTCDEGIVSPWFEADGDTRFYTAPGETETVWIVDLDGHRALLAAGSVVEMTPATRTQLDEMLASIRIP
jgi:Rieske Fe-S protein